MSHVTKNNLPLNGFPSSSKEIGLLFAKRKDTKTLHSKNIRVKLDPKWVHWDQTPFRVKNNPEIGQLSADLTNNGVRLTQLWVIFHVKLTDFRVIVDPSLAQWTLSGSSLTRVSLECCMIQNNII